MSQEDITLMLKYDELLRGVSRLQAIIARSAPSIPTSCFPFYATEVGKGTKNMICTDLLMIYYNL